MTYISSRICVNSINSCTHTEAAEAAEWKYSVVESNDIHAAYRSTIVRHSYASLLKPESLSNVQYLLPIGALNQTPEDARFVRMSLRRQSLTRMYAYSSNDCRQGPLRALGNSLHPPTTAFIAPVRWRVVAYTCCRTVVYTVVRSRHSRTCTSSYWTQLSVVCITIKSNQNRLLQTSMSLKLLQNCTKIEIMSEKANKTN